MPTPSYCDIAMKPIAIVLMIVGILALLPLATCTVLMGSCAIGVHQAVAGQQCRNRFSVRPSRPRQYKSSIISYIFVNIMSVLFDADPFHNSCEVVLWLTL